MYARMESVQRTGQPRLDLRLVGGLLGTLLVGVTAGYLAATLNPQGSSQTLTRTPAASVAAPSGGVYGDRDSRLPYQATAGVWGDHDSRLPIASAASISLGDAWGDRDSRLPYLASLDAALLRGSAAHVTALQGLAGIDWTKVVANDSGDHDSRPPVAPFTGR